MSGTGGWYDPSQDPYAPPAHRPQPEATSSAVPWVIAATAVFVAVSVLLAVPVAMRHRASPPPTVPVSAPGASGSAPTTPSQAGFVLTPPPPAGYEGDAEVFRATGTGPTTTPKFTLHGGGASGGMTQNGSGAYFYLVPADAADGTSGQPTATCNDGCASGGWAARPSPPAGTYRLRVVTTASTRWSFDLTERIIAALSVDVTQNPDGTTKIDAHGVGDQQSRPFTVRGKVVDFGVQLVGGFQDEQAIVFYLVPAGEQLDPTRDVMSQQPAGVGGGWSSALPKPGDYYLVVRTAGPWSVNFTSR